MSSDFLSRIPLFSTLGPEELERLLESTTTVTVPAGEFLFRRGDEGDALYVVESGLLDAVIDEGTSSERTLSTFFPGEFFGEMALLTREPRSASLRAIIDSRLVRVSAEQFADLLANEPGMALHLSRVLSGYLARANQQLSRRGARINTVITLGDTSQADGMAGPLVASLERQFGQRAILVVLGDSAPAGTLDHEAHPDRIPKSVRPLPSGGSWLRLGEAALGRMDDQAMVAVINGLRDEYDHIVVWTRPSEAFRRLSFLTRFHHTFLLASEPFDAGELRGQVEELSTVLQGRLRVAHLAPHTRTPPGLPSTRYPAVKLQPTDAGSDRLARALAGATLGLALGSGTAQGLSHVGVMKALIEAGLPIDLIAGTSGGALYGSFIASGLTIDESVRRVIHETRRNLMDKLDFSIPTRGLIRGNKIEKMIQTIIGDVTFGDLPIPLYAIAADLDTGEEVVIDEGPVYRGVRASISVPGIFEPCALNGRVLVDGVVVNPLPVTVARAMGADVVVAVQVPAPGKVSMEAKGQKGNGARKKDYHLISTIVRSHHFVGDRLADESASDADVFIKPDVTRFGWREYSAAPEIIEAGFQAGNAAVERIAELIRG